MPQGDLSESGASLVVRGRPLLPGRSGSVVAGPSRAIEIRSGRIVAVTEDPHAVSAAVVLGGPESVLMPGLSDSHFHLLATAAARAGMDLARDPPRRLADLLLRLEDARDRAPADGWVRVSGFEPAWLAERRAPALAELDAAVPDRPLRLRHVTRHASYLNSLGLARLARALGPLAPERAPRASDGLFCGVVHGLEQEISHLVGPLPDEELELAIARVSMDLARCGVVRIDEVSGGNDAGRVARLAASVEHGSVRQIVRAFVRDADEVDGAERAASGRLEIAGVKLFAHRAEDAASPAFAAALARARRRGVPVAVHAVEPDCIAGVLDALAEAPVRALQAGVVSPRDRAPDRIEHASLCPPEVARRIAGLGVAVVTQPGFLVERGEKYREEVEEPLWPWLYPLRTLQRMGVVVAAGSDAPVAGFDPSIGISGATSRRTALGNAIGPEEALGAAEALDLYVGQAARVRGAATTGAAGGTAWLAPGAAASFAILRHDPTQMGFSNLEATALVVEGSLAFVEGA